MSSSNGCTRAVLHQPQPVGDQLDQVRVVADEDHRAAVLGQRLDQRLAALDVEVVGRLVEDEQVRRVERREQQAQPRLLPAREPPDLGRRDVGAEPAGRQPRRAACPATRPAAAAPGAAAASRRVQLVDLVLGEVADAQLRRGDLAPGHRRQPVGEQLRQRRLALAVLAEQRDAVVLVDPQVEPAQHRPPVVADADVLEPDDRRRQLLGRRGS